MAACAVWITSATCGGGGPVEGAEPPPRVDIARQLLKRITIDFERNNLDGAVDMISEEIDVPIEIIRTDLQLEGITKCSSHMLEEKDQPAARILRVCLKKANPDGKLIYVIRRAGPDEPEKLYITTIAAAQKRGDVIPPVFSEQVKLFLAEKARREAAWAEAARMSVAATALEKKIEIKSARGDLKTSAASISQAIDIPIGILSDDLEQEGFDLKRPFPFEGKLQPAGELLRGVLKEFDPESNVVFIIKPKTETQRETIFITTRAGAEKRGEKLPPEFAEPEKKP